MGEIRGPTFIWEKIFREGFPSQISYYTTPNTPKPQATIPSPPPREPPRIKVPTCYVNIPAVAVARSGVVWLVQLSTNSTTLSVNARRFMKSSLEPLGNFEHHTVRKAWRKDRDCERHPILSK